MIGDETKKNTAATSFSGKKLADYPVLIHALLDIKKAALLTNHRNGYVEKSAFECVLNVIDVLKQELLVMPVSKREQIFLVDVFGGGGSIGIHLNISEYLSLRSGVPISVINQAQSTADVCHTAFRLAIIKSWPAFCSSIERVITSLDEHAIRYQDVMTLGRTCLQDASVISMGKSLSAFPSALRRRKDSLESIILSLKAINLGGTVMGSGDNAPISYQNMVVKMLSQVADVPLSARENRYDGAQNSDDVGILIAEIAQTTLVLMKLARDLRMLSSGPHGGFSELLLPKVHEGSSFYKDKNNPIVPETMLQCGFLVLGACHVAQSSLQHAELQLNVFDNAVCISVLDCMSWLTNCLLKFHSYCLSGVLVNQDRCLELSQMAAKTKR